MPYRLIYFPIPLVIFVTYGNVNNKRAAKGIGLPSPFEKHLSAGFHETTLVVKLAKVLAKRFQDIISTQSLKKSIEKLYDTDPTIKSKTRELEVQIAKTGGPLLASAKLRAEHQYNLQ